MPRTPAKILTPAEQEERRLKKNKALNDWRKVNREKYNAYIKRWRNERTAKYKALEQENERIKQQLASLTEQPSNDIVADAEELADEIAS